MKSLDDEGEPQEQREKKNPVVHSASLVKMGGAEQLNSFKDGQYSTSLSLEDFDLEISEDFPISRQPTPQPQKTEDKGKMMRVRPKKRAGAVFGKHVIELPKAPKNSNSPFEVPADLM